LRTAIWGLVAVEHCLREAVVLDEHEVVVVKNHHGGVRLV
jgi:hypothetical protein